ncbi:MAG: thymidine kinase [Nocardioidaceae bacterium]|nr:thymidine kinase [Nocardioidaceae bacterium]
MAELQLFTGTMDSGKSTLALQTSHNHAARGRIGRIFTSQDRAGTATLSSRLDLSVDAIEVDDTFNFWHYVVDSLTSGGRIDYLICDEAQFYTPDQVDQLARLVDDLQIDVFAFGIMTDFRTRLFPGSARMVELADRVHPPQVEALCWCGKRATHNARTENGEMVTEGEVIVVGDVERADEPPEVGYEVLCRLHHRRRMTAARAHAAALSPDVLPFG